MDKDEVSNKVLYGLLQSVLKKTECIENQLTSNNEELKQIRNINLENREELERLREENEEIRKENQKLKTRLLTVERKLKKYSIIFYGIKEKENGINETSFILKTIIDELGVECSFSDIRDVSRPGKKTDTENRPLVVEFVNYQLKLQILKASIKLKGTGISVTKDYAPEDYKKQQVLKRNLKSAREQNLEAKIKNNVLNVNGRTYTYEDLANHEVNFTDGADTERDITEKHFESVNTRAEGTTNILEKGQTSVNETSNCKNRKREQPVSSESQVKRSTRLQKS